MGKLWLQLEYFEDHGERGFCVWDGLICRAYPNGGYTIFLFEDKEIC